MYQDDSYINKWLVRDKIKLLHALEKYGEDPYALQRIFPLKNLQSIVLLMKKYKNICKKLYITRVNKESPNLLNWINILRKETEIPDKDINLINRVPVVGKALDEIAEEFTCQTKELDDIKDAIDFKCIFKHIADIVNNRVLEPLKPYECLLMISLLKELDQEFQHYAPYRSELSSRINQIHKMRKVTPKINTVQLNEKESTACQTLNTENVLNALDCFVEPCVDDNISIPIELDRDINVIPNRTDDLKVPSSVSSQTTSSNEPKIPVDMQQNKINIVNTECLETQSLNNSENNPNNTNISEKSLIVNKLDSNTKYSHRFIFPQERASQLANTWPYACTYPKRPHTGYGHYNAGEYAFESSNSQKDSQTKNGSSLINPAYVPDITRKNARDFIHILGRPRFNYPSRFNVQDLLPNTYDAQIFLADELAVQTFLLQGINPYHLPDLPCIAPDGVVVLSGFSDENACLVNLYSKNYKRINHNNKSHKSSDDGNQEANTQQPQIRNEMCLNKTTDNHSHIISYERKRKKP